MNYIDTSHNPKIAVIGCLHGDELFGARVIEALRAVKLPGLRLILANPMSMDRGVRYIDEDLNRCFPGDPRGNQEQRLAVEILSLVEDMHYVIDLHTTTSDIRMTPIVPHLGPGVRQIINVCNSVEVVRMGQRLARHSLIGSVASGVSLEFNEEYAATAAALNEATTIVRSLVENQLLPPRSRRIFKTVKLIPVEAHVPANAVNFAYLPDLDLYPFLLREKSYTTHQGFAAKRYLDTKI